MLRRALLVLAFAALVLSPRAEKHIRDRHFPDGKHTRGKSLFLKDTDLSELLELAEETKPFRQKNGRDKRVTAAGRVVGTDGRTKKPVKTFVTISEPEDGAVITMYPGN